MALVFIALAAIVLTVFLPPRVTFSTLVTSINHLDDGTRTFSVSMVARNSGMLPIWYRDQVDPYNGDHTQPYALAVTRNTVNSEIDQSNAQWAPWTVLSSGQSVKLCLVLRQHELPGIQLQDWLGRHHNVFDNEIEVEIEVEAAQLSD
jgi:hypothetical protein